MNKKIMVLIVIVECVLAVLLIGVIGLAIESTYKEVSCKEVYFTLEDGTVPENNRIYIETNWWEGYQLHYEILPENASNKAVTFTSDKPDKVTVNEVGWVTFLARTSANITIRTENGGKTDTVLLAFKPDTNGGTVDLN